MSIWGKLIGFLVGLFAFHSFGAALLGAVIGHLLIDSGFMWGLAQSGGKDGYVEPLFAIMGTLAKSDGRVSEAEVAIAEKLMTRLELDALWRRRAIDAFNKGKAPGFDLATNAGGLAYVVPAAAQFGDAVSGHVVRCRAGRRSLDPGQAADPEARCVLAACQ